MKKPSWKQKLQYWFDNRMAKGTGSMVWMLLVGTGIVVLAIAGVELLFHFGGDSEPFSVMWDSIAYTVNAWVPFSEDGTVGYIILAAIGGLAGLFFTSTLIGIISSSIEEKVAALRKGNSLVLEQNHTVVLGFTPGEYALLRQLIQAEIGNHACILLVNDIERDEMEQMIRENLSVPKGIRIICRNADICDPNALSICSIPTCSAVVINVLDDDRSTKALLAVAALMERENACERNIPIISAVSSSESLLPQHIRQKYTIITLPVYNLVARLIAHSCTQPGLSQAFLVIFNFEGSEFYLRFLPEAEGKTFAQLVERLDGAVPLGILHEGKPLLNPPPDQKILAGDQLFLFAEDGSAGQMMAKSAVQESLTVPKRTMSAPVSGRVVILGFNEVLKVLLHELPLGVKEVVIADISENDVASLESLSTTDRKLSIVAGKISIMEKLESLVHDADFVVLLSDHEADAEQADLHSIRLLLNLREIKHRLGLSFTITAEMQRESNHNLVAAGDPTDFIIASDIVSNFLAQLAKNPYLYPVFQELLSNEGNELYLKTAAELGCAGKEYTVSGLRYIALLQGYVLLGYLQFHGDERSIHLNPPAQESVTLAAKDSLIVLGRL